MVMTETMKETKDRTPVRARTVVLGGAAAAVVGATIMYGYGALVRSAGVAMHAGEIGASHADPVTPGNFSSGVVFCTFIGTVIAVGLARWAKRPARTFIRTAIVLVAISLVFPLAASHTTTATRLALAGAHVLAAAIVIPIMAAALRRSHV